MKYDYIVSAAGQGDFATLQEAADEAASWWGRLRRRFRRARVLILPGTYTISSKIDVNGIDAEGVK